MKVPNYEHVIIDETKITKYLLLDSPESGKSKAGFFTRFGFSVAKWKILAEALRNHVVIHEVTDTEITEHGKKYIVEGILKTPDERDPFIRSVWLIEHGQTVARLITAYPVKRKAE